MNIGVTKSSNSMCVFMLGCFGAHEPTELGLQVEWVGVPVASAALQPPPYSLEAVAVVAYCCWSARSCCCCSDSETQSGSGGGGEGGGGGGGEGSGGLHAQPQFESV